MPRRSYQPFALSAIFSSSRGTIRYVAIALTPSAFSSLTSFSSPETWSDWSSVTTSAATVLPAKFRLEMSGDFHTARNFGAAVTTTLAITIESATHRERMLIPLPATPASGVTPITLVRPALPADMDFRQAAASVGASYYLAWTTVEEGWPVPSSGKLRRRSEAMAIHRIVGVCFCVVFASAVATAQQRTDTTSQAPAASVTQYTYAAGNRGPSRRVQTRNESGGREVVVETFELPDVEGRLSPARETVTETMRTSPGTAQSRRDVFGFNLDRKRQLVETTDSRPEMLAGGDTSVVHDTWVPGLNGQLGLTSREIE